MTNLRTEIIVVCGLSIVLIVLVYCAVRIQLTSQWLQAHRAYIEERDIRWEAAARKMGVVIDQNTRAIREIKAARP